MKQKNMTIRYPYELWRRIKLLEIDGHIETIAKLTLQAVEKEVTRLEKKTGKTKEKE